MSDAWFDLFRSPIPPEVIGLLPASIAHEDAVIPVRCTNEVVVAMAYVDPNVLEKLRFVLGREVSVVLASRQAIRYALARYYPES